MLNVDIVERIKIDLRIGHHLLDEDISDMIRACCEDLFVCGIPVRLESEGSRGVPLGDPLVFAAIRLWCRAFYQDDTVKAAAYMARYNSLKATLIVSRRGLADTDTDAGTGGDAP